MHDVVLSRQGCGYADATFRRFRGPTAADMSTVEWSGVPAETLPETLQTALPVCFACHMANTLVRERPDLVTDRSRRISV